MIQQFIQFAGTSPLELTRLPESAPLLRRYASTILQNEPVTLDDVLAFLLALDDLEDIGEGQHKNYDAFQKGLSLFYR